MADWVPIIGYRDFYDVPHLFAARLGERLLLFESRLDESLDDYTTDFSVYELPEGTELLEDGSWDRLSDGLTRIAAVLLRDVEFGHDGEGRYAFKSDAAASLGRPPV